MNPEVAGGNARDGFERYGKLQGGRGPAGHDRGHMAAADADTRRQVLLRHLPLTQEAPDAAFQSGSLPWHSGKIRTTRRRLSNVTLLLSPKVCL